MSQVDAVPPAWRAVLDALKHLGPASAADVGQRLGISREAARQHLARLEAEALVTAAPDRTGGGGRPSRRYRLTRAGEHLFPKAYGDLAVLLIDTVGRLFGGDAVVAALQAVVDAKVEAWRPALAGLGLRERAERLREVYVAGDPWVEVVEDERGLALVERNCPFLDVAVERPALCTVTVTTLSRLLERRVVRERAFQAGHGRCVFRVTDAPVPEGLADPTLAD